MGAAPRTERSSQPRLFGKDAFVIGEKSELRPSELNGRRQCADDPDARAWSVGERWYLISERR